MVFITLGSQKFQFDRLLKAVDELVAAGRLQEEIFAQIGYSDYKPQHYAYQDFLDREKFTQRMEEADIVVTHGGTGAIIGAVKKGKKVIAIPRLAKYGEHVDDHQVQIIEQFKELDLICACMDVDQMEASFAFVKDAKFKEYVSNTQTIIDSIEAFLEE